MALEEQISPQDFVLFKGVALDGPIGIHVDSIGATKQAALSKRTTVVITCDDWACTSAGSRWLASAVEKGIRVLHVTDSAQMPSGAGAGPAAASSGAASAARGDARRGSSQVYPQAPPPSNIVSPAVLLHSHWNDWQPYVAGTLKPLPVPGERRPSGEWVGAPDKGVTDRIKRARQQRMLLMDRSALGYREGYRFDVLGSTGNVYRVTIEARPSCTCPDAARMYGRGQCKHVCLVLLKALRVPPDHPLMWQSSFMSHELKYMLDNAPDPVRAAALADEGVRRAYAAAMGVRLTVTGEAAAAASSSSSAPPAAAAAAAAAVVAVADAPNRRVPTDEDDCPICLEGLGTSTATLTFCLTCGNNLHGSCMGEWVTSKSRSGSAVTCPFCRSAWKDPRAVAAAAAARAAPAVGSGAGGGMPRGAAPIRGGHSPSAAARGRDGYYNLAGIAGIDPARGNAAAAYFESAAYRRRRREYEDEGDDEDWTG